ncbi:hypothetical protein H0S70_13425 [Chryseobacterium manosquense]|uniref:Uncharacterized protein n=1 Tax=Chryseobacterium manosquense TaxID=2754694 RepID=A0A7H1DWE5_9FLAO|nr:hypothetical protein [Chryseobacterium manosquense]QNS41303.1 hypothetical protein H0S70_13425 [Chryseobacterium manosquense]
MNESAENQIHTLFYAEPAEVRAGEMNLTFRCYCLKDLIWKEEHKNFQQSFTPTPKGRLMEILSKGVEKIKFTPFSVGENEFDFRRICLKI